MEEKNIKKYSITEIEKMIQEGNYVPTDKGTMEFSVDNKFWDDAKIAYPQSKRSVHLRIDENVLEWFKAQGSGHLTKMQAVLKSYYEAHTKNI